MHYADTTEPRISELEITLTARRLQGVHVRLMLLRFRRWAESMAVRVQNVRPAPRAANR